MRIYTIIEKFSKNKSSSVSYNGDRKMGTIMMGVSIKMSTSSHK
jgi:hypothetical protein